MRFFVIMLLVIPLAITAEEGGDTITIDLSKVELPDRVVKAEEALNTDLDRLAEQYRAAVEAAKAKAVRDMEREKSRARDLMTAAAIDAKIKEVQAIGTEEGGGLDLLGSKPEVKMVGSWTVRYNDTGWSNTLDVREDNTFRASNGMTGKWSHDDGKLKFQWSNGAWEEYSCNRITAEMVGSSHSHGDDSVTLTRSSE